MTCRNCEMNIYLKFTGEDHLLAGVFGHFQLSSGLLYAITTKNILVIYYFRKDHLRPHPLLNEHKTWASPDWKPQQRPLSSCTRTLHKDNSKQTMISVYDYSIKLYFILFWIIHFNHNYEGPLDVIVSLSRYRTRMSGH